jgi:hypothetical protein
MTRLLYGALAGAMLLAGCGDDGGSRDARRNAAAEATPEGSNIVEQVIAMDDRHRNVVFVRALLDSNIRCDAVTDSVRVKDIDTHPAWRAHCKNGSYHIITLHSDGTARVYTRPESTR